MSSLQCPLPENINPLSPNGFMLSIEKLPKLTYFCQTSQIPQLALPNAIQSTPFVDLNPAGDKLEFSELIVQFIVDEDMKNYIEIFNWLVGLSYPEKNEQYSNFISQQRNNLSELAKQSSDGTLSILGSNFLPVNTLRFVDLVPTSLSSLEFSSTSTDVQYLIGTATFKYSYYYFE